MKIATAEQMKYLDSKTIEAEGISSLQLMERAASAVVEELCLRWDTSRSFLIFAGAGNNGGDALAIARMLLQRDYKVDVFLFNTEGKLSPDCEDNRRRLHELFPAALTEVTSSFVPPKVDPQTIIVDGLFGTGLREPLTGGFAALVKFINSQKAFTLAIDMPSGLLCDADSQAKTAPIVKANLTLTFQLPKLNQILADNQRFIGELKILDLQLSPTHLAALHTDFHITELAEILSLLRQRPVEGHKGTFGQGLLIAGRFGMAGAAVLAAQAALRSGIGKLVLHTPLRNNDILQISVPEAVLSHDNSETHFTTAPLTKPFSAVGIGSGIGTAKETAQAFAEVLHSTTTPMVIDADGINLLAQNRTWLRQLPKDTILTPHLVEFQRIGSGSDSVYTNLQEARQLAQNLGIYIVLKGRYTAICQPNGQVCFNPTGNSGMATAGSGDVLTGILTSLLAQGYPPLHAAKIGVYLHGAAGDYAATTLGEESVTATDLINHLPAAFLSLHHKHQT